MRAPYGGLVRSAPSDSSAKRTRYPPLSPLAVFSYDGDRSIKDLLKFVAYRRTTEPGPLNKVAAEQVC